MDGDNKNNKEYICQHVGCNKPFKSRSARMYHQKRCSTGPLQSPRRKAKKVATEAGIKKKCRYCPKTFNHAASLSRHQKKDCEAARLFAGKSPSKKRPRTKKSFHCAECDKCFDRLSKYNAHLMTHQRKMHECPDCFKQFKRIDKFKNHSCSSSELESMSFVPVHHASLPSSASLEPSLLDVEETDQSLDVAEADSILSSSFMNRFENHSCSSSELESISLAPRHHASLSSSASLEPSLLDVEETDQSLDAAEADSSILSSSFMNRFKNHSCSSSEIGSLVPRHHASLSSGSQEPSLFDVEETDPSLIAVGADRPIPSSSFTRVHNSCSTLNIQNSTIDEEASEFEASGRSELEAYIDSVGHDCDIDQELVLVLPNDYVPELDIPSPAVHTSHNCQSKEVDPGAEGPEVTTVNTQYTPATNNSDVVMEMGENMLMTGLIKPSNLNGLDSSDNLVT